MNSIFEIMLSQYSPTTKDGYVNALHEVKPYVKFFIDMKILTDYQCFLPVKAFMLIERTKDLKSPIFITAGQRPAVEEPTNNLCLKGSRLWGRILVRRSLTYGYENKALWAICSPIYYLEHTLKIKKTL
ncbi:hypothetical protein AGMMS4957_15630 [Bacteroidia bacterium]|nr:hypothetical protein AGMMS4957_15630 [Bacteroidia bacterium]